MPVWSFALSILLLTGGLMVFAEPPVEEEDDCHCRWERYAHDVHREQVGDILPILKAVNAALPADVLKGPELADVNTLLSLTNQPVRVTELLGKWRVRSLQVSRDLGVFTYPWFACEVTRNNGRFLFRKTNGSQRRLGQLFDSGVNRIVFLGGTYVNEDPPRSYSGLQTPRTGPEESDTTGVLTCIGPKRWIMFLDVSPTGYEIYEIRK